MRGAGTSSGARPNLHEIASSVSRKGISNNPAACKAFRSVTLPIPPMPQPGIDQVNSASLPSLGI